MNTWFTRIHYHKIFNVDSPVSFLLFNYVIFLALKTCVFSKWLSLRIVPGTSLPSWDRPVACISLISTKLSNPSIWFIPNNWEALRKRWRTWVTWKSSALEWKSSSNGPRTFPNSMQACKNLPLQRANRSRCCMTGLFQTSIATLFLWRTNFRN